MFACDYDFWNSLNDTKMFELDASLEYTYAGGNSDSINGTITILLVENPVYEIEIQCYAMLNDWLNGTE